MKFNNKIYKISSGTNVNLYATDASHMDLYVCNKFVTKKQLSLEPVIRCLSTNTSFNAGYVKKINDNYICICFDDIISVQHEK